MQSTSVELWSTMVRRPNPRQTFVEFRSDFGRTWVPRGTLVQLWLSLSLKSHSQAIPAAAVDRWEIVVDGPYVAMVDRRAWVLERHDARRIECIFTAKGLRLAHHLAVRPAGSDVGTRRPKWHLCSCHVPAGGKKIKVHADHGRGHFLHTVTCTVSCLAQRCCFARFCPHNAVASRTAAHSRRALNLCMRPHSGRLRPTSKVRPKFGQSSAKVRPEFGQSSAKVRPELPSLLAPHSAAVSRADAHQPLAASVLVLARRTTTPPWPSGA